MRGPLLSGPVGSPATLERLALLLDAAPGVGEGKPVVVLSTVWLGQVLSEGRAVLLIVEPEKLRAARKAQQQARKGDRRLDVVIAGEELPLLRAGAAAVVVEAASELPEDDAQPFIATLVPYLGRQGVVVGLDGTKDPAVEARLSRYFLAAHLTDIAQERPRDGALITTGRSPE